MSKSTFMIEAVDTSFKEIFCGKGLIEFHAMAGDSYVTSLPQTD